MVLFAVNNVGSNIRKATVDYTAEDYSFIQRTNMESAYNLTQVSPSPEYPARHASGAACPALQCPCIYMSTLGVLQEWHRRLHLHAPERG